MSFLTSVFGGNKIVEDYHVIAHAQSDTAFHVITHNGICHKEAFIKEEDAIECIKELINKIIQSDVDYKKMVSGRTTLLYNKNILVHKFTYTKVQVKSGLY